LPELALRLLNERVNIRMAEDPYRGRYVQRVQNPPLTGPEQAALAGAVEILHGNLTPGHRAATIATLARLANHRAKERTADEWRMLFEDYAEDIGEFSNAHVKEAVTEHRRNSNWFPTSAELRKRCLELVDRDRFRLERAERMLGETQ
jgi:hypothetical protein